MMADESSILGDCHYCEAHSRLIFSKLTEILQIFVSDLQQILSDQSFCHQSHQLYLYNQTDGDADHLFPSSNVCKNAAVSDYQIAADQSYLKQNLANFGISVVKYDDDDQVDDTSATVRLPVDQIGVNHLNNNNNISIADLNNEPHRNSTRFDHHHHHVISVESLNNNELYDEECDEILDNYGNDTDYQCGGGGDNSNAVLLYDDVNEQPDLFASGDTRFHIGEQPSFLYRSTCSGDDDDVASTSKSSGAVGAGAGAVRRRGASSNFKCNLCYLKLASLPELKLHLQEHASIVATKQQKVSHRQQPHKCEICSKSFKMRFELKQHMSVDHDSQSADNNNKPPTEGVDKKRSVVVDDGKIMSSLAYLNQHISSNQLSSTTTTSAAVDNRCSVCGKCFRTKQLLKLHTQCHTGPKQYKCEVCHRGFSRRCILNDHKHSHTGERPYSCCFCGRTYAAKQSLYIHRRSCPKS